MSRTPERGDPGWGCRGALGIPAPALPLREAAAVSPDQTFTPRRREMGQDRVSAGKGESGGAERKPGGVTLEGWRFSCRGLTENTPPPPKKG